MIAVEKNDNVGFLIQVGDVFHSFQAGPAVAWSRFVNYNCTGCKCYFFRFVGRVVVAHYYFADKTLWNFGDNKTN